MMLRHLPPGRTPLFAQITGYALFSVHFRIEKPFCIRLHDNRLFRADAHACAAARAFCRIFLLPSVLIAFPPAKARTAAIVSSRPAIYDGMRALSCARSASPRRIIASYAAISSVSPESSCAGIRCPSSVAKQIARNTPRLDRIADDQRRHECRIGRNGYMCSGRDQRRKPFHIPFILHARSNDPDKINTRGSSAKCALIAESASISLSCAHVTCGISATARSLVQECGEPATQTHPAPPPYLWRGSAPAD